MPCVCKRVIQHGNWPVLVRTPLNTGTASPGCSLPQRPTQAHANAELG